MANFYLSRLATKDLVEIREYLGNKNPQASHKIVQQLKKSMLLLTENPYIGHVTDDEDVYEWHVSGTRYSLPYMIIDGNIHILRVFSEYQERPESWIR